MAKDKPFFELADHWVIVWIGELNSQELEDYLEEPGHAGDDEPISAFARDLNRWYDHDFIWAEGAKEKVSVSQLCKLNQVEPAEFAAEIERRAGIIPVSSLLILWNARRIEGSSHEFANGKLRCIGSWPQESPLIDPS